MHHIRVDIHTKNDSILRNISVRGYIDLQGARFKIISSYTGVIQKHFAHQCCENLNEMPCVPTYFESKD